MKSMTCKELGGVCDTVLRAETFEEMIEYLQEHGRKMFIANDQEHVNRIYEMKQCAQDSSKMKAWFDEKRSLFTSV